MKPRLVSVDLAAREMTVVFPATERGGAGRWIIVRLKSRVHTEKAARAAAEGELAAMTAEQLGLLCDSAKFGAPAPDIQPVAVTNALSFAGMVAAAEQQQDGTALHCPACGFRIGLTSSPHITYVDECSACGVHLMITIETTGAMIAFSTEKGTAP